MTTSVLYLYSAVQLFEEAEIAVVALGIVRILPDAAAMVAAGAVVGVASAFFKSDHQ
jgi:hypothetical protein